MDTTEKLIEDYAFEADLTLLAAREVQRLIAEAIELLGTHDEERVHAYVRRHIMDAFDRGEQWAVDYITTQAHRRVARCVEEAEDPVAAVQAAFPGVDRRTAERWVREEGGG